MHYRNNESKLQRLKYKKLKFELLFLNKLYRVVHLCGDKKKLISAVELSDRCFISGVRLCLYMYAFFNLKFIMLPDEVVFNFLVELNCSI